MLTPIQSFSQNVLIPYGKILSSLFFLPFKQNEDINPTEASYVGMNPEHLAFAIQECSYLQQQGLIEPTDFLWAYEAFYVNKKSEQV